jgi:glycogen(starch) synthase
MSARWGGSRYCLVGPYDEKTAGVEFESRPPHGSIGQVVQQIRDMGFGVEYGRWLVSGRPHVVLLHVKDFHRQLDAVKYRLWADHGIPTPGNDDLINNVVAFGEAVRLFLTLLNDRESDRRQLVAHFHEWMGAAALPMLRHEGWTGTSVFTTHATLLGRYLAMHNPVFYDHLAFFNPSEEAKHFNIEAQHGLERAAAHSAQVFTTVSSVTAQECTHLLGRTPDEILPNGLNIERFTALHEFQNLHQQYKEQIHEFTIGHFFPSYSFDLDQTLYMFTSGRYEYRNKGMDLTIEALARLNHELKASEIPTTVVFFIVTKAPVRSINVGTLQSNAMLHEFHDAAEAIKEQIGRKLFYAAAAGSLPDLNALIDDYWRLRMRRALHAWKRDYLPPIVTHDLIDDQKDAVLNQLRTCRLFNQQHDRVKIVYHPDFINSSNPLFNMDYEQFVRGTHLGVFPSYYEPWGYTPLESIALGVPAITSDLSGFGAYLQELKPDRRKSNGLFILNRRGRDFDAAANQLTQQMLEFCQLNRRERIAMRNTVEAFSEQFDWHNLSRKYHDAHELAIKRVE